jgi:hypothetical protein
MKYKELLELAAKAAGYEYAKNGGYIVVDGIPGNWNPLSDDGDALRLAVRLEIDVSFGLRGAVIEQVHGRKIQELDDDEPYAATRRAIVRAAAEIGRSMK